MFKNINKIMYLSKGINQRNNIYKKYRVGLDGQYIYLRLV